MAGSFIYNGKVFAADEKVIGPGSRALRYGDGLFETMRMVNGEIPLARLHFDRLFRGLNTLQFSVPVSFTPDYLASQIKACVELNKVQGSARIRLNVFRSEGGLFTNADPEPNFIIEASALDVEYVLLNEQGWKIDIYPYARKSCDLFSAIKHNNFQPYVMAARYAVANGLDDALVLNQYDRIADSTMANLFIVKNKRIITNTTDEGCIEGVFRRHLVERWATTGITVSYQPIHLQDLLDADELFLTNAVAQMRWVSTFRKKMYGCELVKELFSLIN